ncbi:MAG: NAD-dependent deacylase [Anaerolineales bacterium]|nr:NAD-dependent deacylase [Anaerolineales bacterium]
MSDLILPSDLITTLQHARHLAVLTGAGISAESGIPTFREAQTGLWANYSPEDLATPEAFRRNPKLVWDWYTWRRELVAKAEPNAGHRALVGLAQLVPRLTLITQNVDGLHTRAGSTDVIELHGNLTRCTCLAAGHLVDAALVDAALPGETAVSPPLCPHCGSPLRPDVVWFGENLPRAALQQAVAASQSCDLFLSVGTSSLVQPAASLPLEALERGKTAVEINPQPTPLAPYMDYVLRGSAGTVLPALVAALDPGG